MRSSSVRFALRRFAGGWARASAVDSGVYMTESEGGQVRLWASQCSVVNSLEASLIGTGSPQWVQMTLPDSYSWGVGSVGLLEGCGEGSGDMGEEGEGKEGRLLMGWKTYN